MYWLNWDWRAVELGASRLSQRWSLEPSEWLLTLEGQRRVCGLAEVGRGAIRKVRILAEEARE